MVIYEYLRACSFISLILNFFFSFSFSIIFSFRSFSYCSITLHFSSIASCRNFNLATFWNYRFADNIYLVLSTLRFYNYLSFSSAYFLLFSCNYFSCYFLASRFSYSYFLIFYYNWIFFIAAVRSNFLVYSITFFIFSFSSGLRVERK